MGIIQEKAENKIEKIQKGNKMSVIPRHNMPHPVVIFF